MEIPVIIVTCQSAEHISSCIRSVLDASAALNLKIIVIDNASTDQTVSIIKSEFPEIRLIENQKNLGFARAVNQGLRITHQEFVVLINPDVILQNNAIELCIDALRHTPRSWCMGAVTTNEQYIPKFPGITKITFEQLGLHKILQKIYRKLFFAETLNIHLQKEPSEVDYTNGAFMCLRSQPLQQYGLFDEDFFIYSEETELCTRMKKHGWLCHLYPEAKIIHKTGSSTKKLSAELLTRIHRKSLLLLFKKTRSNAYVFAVRLVFTLGDLLRIFFKHPAQTTKLLALNWSV